MLKQIHALENTSAAAITSGTRRHKRFTVISIFEILLDAARDKSYKEIAELAQRTEVSIQQQFSKWKIKKKSCIGLPVYECFQKAIQLSKEPDNEAYTQLYDYVHQYPDRFKTLIQALDQDAQDAQQDSKSKTVNSLAELEGLLKNAVEPPKHTYRMVNADLITFDIIPSPQANGYHFIGKVETSLGIRNILFEGTLREATDLTAKLIAFTQSSLAELLSHTKPSPISLRICEQTNDVVAINNFLRNKEWIKLK